MNNLHRELAPISDAAWADLEAEARRTFTSYVAGRRVVDVTGPDGPTLAAVGTGHVRPLDPPADGVLASRREAQHLIELRVPFSVERRAVDSVERGAKDADWQPVKDAAKKIAFAEDRAALHGWADAGIAGLAPSSSNSPLPLPADVRDLPAAVARAGTALREQGVGGPYDLLLSAASYTAVAESTDHGYPVWDHLVRLVPEGRIIWAPALDGALLVSTRGGDFELRLGQDLSIGYLAHDAERVQLYFQESLTFMVHTAEASVALPPG
ncbi:family 1 encapsulin nanocompartment shell protein [Actinomadura chibensis]|uniref:Type 1 encapsulin shell protein n=1 Tax=Actinomadura chibensis TaxID=392828 RepID=A0A5D0NN87_9ACTN|nr:family 1 encapsulin nanocompartment shell protein [Actinomadura chibensis]TYB45471.1 bacteriocin [Actinomadura chibensis]